jgi:hypothetical protein|tara:strand:- start:305 stop:511 length:207 start_codon:yes stop_codon:yes gene_type:complete
MKRITAVAILATPSLASAHTDYVAHVHVGFLSEIQELATNISLPVVAIPLAVFFMVYGIRKFSAKRKS